MDLFEYLYLEMAGGLDLMLVEPHLYSDRMVLLNQGLELGDPRPISSPQYVGFQFLDDGLRAPNEHHAVLFHQVRNNDRYHYFHQN